MDELKIINEYKYNGDLEFKNENFSKALRNYYNGKIYIISLFPEFKPTNNNIVDSFTNNKKNKNLDEKVFKEILIKILNNMALIYLKQQKYKKCIDSVDQLIIFNKDNVKALHRKYLSLLELKDFQRVKNVLETLIILNKDNKDYKDKLKIINNELNKQDKQSFNKFKGFFN